MSSYLNIRTVFFISAGNSLSGLLEDVRFLEAYVPIKYGLHPSANASVEIESIFIRIEEVFWTYDNDDECRSHSHKNVYSFGCERDAIFRITLFITDVGTVKI